MAKRWETSGGWRKRLPRIRRTTNFAQRIDLGERRFFCYDVKPDLQLQCNPNQKLTSPLPSAIS